MLKELKKYENLGTPKFFHELFQQLSSSDVQWTRDNIREYFYNKIVDTRAVFDGCLPLAEAIGAVTVSEQGLVSLNPSLKVSLVNEKYLSNKMLEMIVFSLQKDEIFHTIFCSENMSYDIIYRLIQIENKAFQFRYKNFRQLLISFSFLYPHPDQNIRKFIVNSKYKKLFDRELLPEIKKRKMGIDELERMLEQKQIHGKEAEIFVLGFEKIRLSSHPKIGSIEIISEYDVGAGYDLVSYETPDSDEYDRFIEVKSFSGNPSFHWSRNEVDTARIKKNYYFLYLIDRDKMAFSDYSPIIIRNPYEEIIVSGQNLKWEKRIEEYVVTQI